MKKSEEFIGVRVSREQRAILEHISQKYHLGISNLVRKIIYEWLSEHLYDLDDKFKIYYEMWQAEIQREITKFRLKKVNFKQNVERRLKRVLQSNHITDNDIISLAKTWSEEAEALGINKKEFYNFFADVLASHFGVLEDEPK